MRQAISGKDGGRAALKALGLTAVPKPRMVAKPPKKYVKRVNPKRAAIRKARDFGDIADFLVTLPCCVCGARTGELARVWGDPKMEYVNATVVSAHVKSRGAGGRSHANQIPLAQHLHEIQHREGWESIGLTKEIARDLAAGYQNLFNEKFATSDETGDTK